MYTQLCMSFEPLNNPGKRTFNHQSKEAEESVKETKESHYKKILEAYRRSPNGLTAEECSSEAGISYESAHKRIPELVSKRKLYNTGLTRNNKSGRKAEVRKYVSIKINHNEKTNIL